MRLLTTSAHRSSAKHPPEHEEEADSDDGAEYDRVLPLLEVDLLDEAVDEGEAVGDVVELGAHGLEVGGVSIRGFTFKNQLVAIAPTTLAG